MQELSSTSEPPKRVAEARLCDEDDRHGFIQRGAVHVDRSGQGQHKLHHSLIEAHVPGTGHRHLQHSIRGFGENLSAQEDKG